MSWLVLAQSIHGYLAVLSVASLVHPAVLLRRGKPLSRGGVWAVVLAALTTALAYAMGIAIYGAYRQQVKRPLFQESVVAGLGFETKEHLAVLVLAFALGAAVAALSAPRSRGDLRKAAAVLFALAALGGLVTGALGASVAAVRSFAG